MLAKLGIITVLGAGGLYSVSKAEDLTIRSVAQLAIGVGYCIGINQIIKRDYHNQQNPQAQQPQNLQLRNQTPLYTPAPHPRDTILYTDDHRSVTNIDNRQDNRQVHIHHHYPVPNPPRPFPPHIPSRRLHP